MKCCRYVFVAAGLLLTIQVVAIRLIAVRAKCHDRVTQSSIWGCIADTGWR
jgi:hypothetical protein